MEGQKKTVGGICASLKEGEGGCRTIGMRGRHRREPFWQLQSTQKQMSQQNKKTGFNAANARTPNVERDVKWEGSKEGEERDFILSLFGNV